MRAIIEYVQLCHIHFYQKIARKKVACVNAALGRVLGLELGRQDVPGLKNT